MHVRNAMPASFTIEGSYTKGSSTLGLWHINKGSGTAEPDDDYTGEQQTATLPSSGCWTNASGGFYRHGMSFSTPTTKSATGR